MNKLQNLHKELAKEYKNKKALNQNINNNNNQNKNRAYNNQNTTSIRFKKTLRQSFLFNVKEQRSKIDLYKTVNLFKDNEDDLSEIDRMQLLKRNYHEICYVYDDYDIHDVYYELKAVGLMYNFTYPKAYDAIFAAFDKVEIQSFSIDGVSSPYKFNFFNSIEFDVNLHNLESVKIHLIYKVTKNLDFLSTGQIEQRKIYRTDTYGLSLGLAGQKAKCSLILKGNFDIVNFKDYFLIRNTNNLNDVEYMWGGIDLLWEN